MDTVFRIVNIPNQQTGDTLQTQTSNSDGTAISTQSYDPERLRDTGICLTEHLNDAFNLAHNDLSPECYDYNEISHDEILKLARSSKLWFEPQGKNFRCQICGGTCRREDNFKRHLRGTKTCEDKWACLGEAERWMIFCKSLN
ncbi:hypothetical protein GGR57DRAFT_395649 [Xylariaceae sp. FL1272]|nr:hypothetical protein GGR57DRAFT_395649 [Xylariaceae sp. FL1272]